MLEKHKCRDILHLSNIFRLCSTYRIKCCTFVKQAYKSVVARQLFMIWRQVVTNTEPICRTHTYMAAVQSKYLSNLGKIMNTLKEVELKNTHHCISLSKRRLSVWKEKLCKCNSNLKLTTAGSSLRGSQSSMESGSGSSRSRTLRLRLVLILLSMSG